MTIQGRVKGMQYTTLQQLADEMLRVDRERRKAWERNDYSGAHQLRHELQILASFYEYELRNTIEGEFIEMGMERPALVPLMN